MRAHLWAKHVLALIIPILLAGLTSLLLGWPVRTPSFGVLVLVPLWFALTIFIGVKWSARNLSSSSIANYAFVGFAIGTVALVCAFFIPTISNECGTTYYHYSLPSLNQWVQNLAEILYSSGCG